MPMASDDGPARPGPAVTVAPAHQKVRIATEVSAGLLIRKTMPVYPAVARAMHLSGRVALTATISKSGTIENLRVISGPPLLQQAAIDAVQTWLYRPYLLDGQPVEVETNVDVIFTLGR